MTGRSDDPKSTLPGDLIRQAKSGSISRRDLIRRAVPLGVGGAALDALLGETAVEARDAPDLYTYQQFLTEIQQIVSRDDPPAIYYVQPQWGTYIRKDVAGFAFNPINIGTFNFWRMSRTV